MNCRLIFLVTLLAGWAVSFYVNWVFALIGVCVVAPFAIYAFRKAE